MQVAALEDDIDEFETNQSVLAAYFLYCGHEVVDTEWENGVCTFFFHNTDSLKADLLTFVSSEARVEPVQYNSVFGQVMKLVKDARAGEKRRLGLKDNQRLEDHKG